MEYARDVCVGYCRGWQADELAGHCGCARRHESRKGAAISRKGEKIMGDERFRDFVASLRLLCREFEPSIGEMTRAMSVVMNGRKNERREKHSAEGDAKLHASVGGQGAAR